MKFGAHLECCQLPEWRGQYLPYRPLKRRLKAIVGDRARASARGLGPRLRHFLSAPLVAGGDGEDAAGTGVGTPASASTDAAAREPCNGERVEEWRRDVGAEAQRIGLCVWHGVEELRRQLLDLAVFARTSGLEWHGCEGERLLRLCEGSETPGSLCEAPPPVARLPQQVAHLELRLLDALVQLAEGSTRLRSYVDLNHAALYKLWEKHDKLLASAEGLSSHYPRLAEATGLIDLQALEAVDANIQQAILSRRRFRRLEASGQVARIVTGLGMGRASGAVPGVQDAATVAEWMLFFFLGFSTAMMMAIAVLIALPCKEPETFSMAYFLAPLSVFRIVLSTLLLLWGVGCGAYVCERRCIKYFFILSVDPRCRVGPSFFFSQAALLTSLWIFIYAAYVVDYKWMVLPHGLSSTGFNSRSSWHYALYPTMVLGITVVLALRPSRLCRCRYRGQLAMGVARTCAAPLFPVTFSDNFIGDVMTSLAKPLQDVPRAFCYLFSHHPQVPRSVELFTEYGSTCPPWEHSYVNPLVSGAPFVFRLLQCGRRYRDTGELKHLCNLGKYSASVLVVIVTSFWGKNVACVVLVSAFATAYAAAWDVLMDWGLSANDLISLVRGTEPEDLRPGITELHEAQSCPSPASTTTRRHACGRSFSRRFYRSAVMFDIAARSTWVLTLIPIALLSEDIVCRALLETSITIVEIARRSLWAVLRIEHEQIATASSFSALFWVPMQMRRSEPAMRHQGGEPLL